MPQPLVADPRSIAFGPIPSRRLGRSLGVNNIPPKHCTYDCVYCQVGVTPRTSGARRTFYAPEVVIRAVAAKVEECRAAGEVIEHISFVPDGEPTLDIHLGKEIAGVRVHGIPVAVISNGSTLWMPDVRADLAQADVVSIEVDAVRSAPWRRVNRGYRGFDVDTIHRGILDFARTFRGQILTQTMLIDGLNDDPDALRELAVFLAKLAPKRCFLAVPTRPPADSRVQPASDAAVVRAHAILAEYVPVELLVGHEQGAFGRTGDVVSDLLAILAVHPMRDDAVGEYLAAARADRQLIERLIFEGRVARVQYAGHSYLARPARRT